MDGDRENEKSEHENWTDFCRAKDNYKKLVFMSGKIAEAILKLS